MPLWTIFVSDSDLIRPLSAPPLIAYTFLLSLLHTAIDTRTSVHPLSGGIYSLARHILVKRPLAHLPHERSFTPTPPPLGHVNGASPRPRTHRCAALRRKNPLASALAPRFPLFPWLRGVR